jgi:hypothetical protein
MKVNEQLGATDWCNVLDVDEYETIEIETALPAVCTRQRKEMNDETTPDSAGLTMWQMWQMPRASGLRGASGSRENFFQPVSIK